MLGEPSPARSALDEQLRREFETVSASTAKQAYTHRAAVWAVVIDWHASATELAELLDELAKGLPSVPVVAVVEKNVADALREIRADTSVLTSPLKGEQVVKAVRELALASADEVLERIATNLIMLDAAEVPDSGLNEDLEYAARFATRSGSPNAEAIAETVSAITDRIRDVVDEEATLGDGAIDLLGRLVSAMQAALHAASMAGERDALAKLRKELTEAAMTGGSPRALARDDPARQQREVPGDALTLADEIDEDIFEAFLAVSRSVPDAIEQDIVALEQGDRSVLDDLRGRVHSLKGDAATLGLNGLESVCNAFENLLEHPNPITERADRLLRAKDWFGEALNAYSARRHPVHPSAEIVALLQSPPPSERSAPATPQKAVPSSDETSVGSLPITLVGDEFMNFLPECNEWLVQADQLLLDIEQAGTTPEKIDSLFRIFHNIKGTASLLDLGQLVSCAHHAEDMLTQVRAGALSLTGATLEAAFAATTMARRLLEFATEAVENARPLQLAGDLQPLLTRLQREAGSESSSEPSPNAPAAAVKASAPAAKPAVETGAATPETKDVEPVQKSTETAVQKRSAENRPEPRAARPTVTVDLERVDSLVELIGELVIVEAMVSHASEQGQITAPGVRGPLSQFSKLIADLQHIGMRMRMVPLSGAFRKTSRMVRDLARKSGKSVHLELSGENTEMDRNLVEQLGDPLVHLLRNAVDHGIETAEARAAAGKPKAGTIHLSAYHKGGSVVIQVRDDGRGLNRDAILRKARERGLVPDDKRLGDAEIDKLIFAPGFSTAEEVTEISGRGVGMDVVRRNIEALRGRIHVSSVLGQGTTFELILPLTLAIIDGTLVSCGDETYILPTLSIVESLRLNRSMISTLGGKREVLKLRGDTIPLRRLEDLLSIDEAIDDLDERYGVIVEANDKTIAVMVDEVITQQQVVIKSFDTGDENARQYFSGAAILSDGTVGLIINIDALGRADGHSLGRLQAQLPADPSFHEEMGEP